MEPLHLIRVAWVSGLYSCYCEQRLRLIILVYNTLELDAGKQEIKY